jgi:formamidopyrimidine-DNA glycosylase
MPELPEVQTIINTLKETTLLKHTIKHVEIVIEKVLKNCSVSKFKSFLMSEQIIDIQRKGKYIIFHLSNDKY